MKNMLILFLSPVRIDKATGEPSCTRYDNIADVPVETRTTNESALRYLQRELVRKGETIDKVFIWASTGTTKPIKDYREAGCSSLDYFKQQVHELVPGAQIAEQVYDETVPLTDVMGPVLEMAGKVRSYISGLPAGSEAVLHADVTGGPRYANMMMMDILRLMQYSDISIGHVLYSNYNLHRVDEADSIYQLFDLVSGAEEFVNFGSVNALEKYFRHHEEQVTEPLRGLLAAMHRFADELRLCHSGRLRTAAIELRQALADFRAARPGYGLQEELFAQFESRIERDYAPLLQDGADDLSLIGWCLDHDYLQQALTLYVERVPDYMVARGLVAGTDFGERIVRAAWRRNEMPSSYAFYLLTQFKPSDVKARKDRQAGKDKGESWLQGNDRELWEKAEEKIGACKQQNEKDLTAARKQLKGIYKSAVSSLQGGQKPDGAVQEQIADLLEDYPAVYIEHPERVQAGLARLEEWVEQPQLLRDLGPTSQDGFYDQLVQMVRQQHGDEWLAKNFVYGTQKRKAILACLKQANDDQLAAIFSGCARREGYADRFCSYIEAGLATVSLPLGEFRTLLADYGYFKSERNSSNHARQDEDTITAEALKEHMRASLQRFKEQV